jgi:uncharacterized phage-associated protein
MPVSAASAANAILRASEERGIAIDPMKLQKLMYLTNGYYAGITGKPWINEPFEAWDYGPVLPSVYRYFRTFGANPIKKGARVATRVDGPSERKDPALTKALEFVMDKYGSRSAIYLSELTHKIGSPWHKIKNTQDGKTFRNLDIPFDSILEYFKGLVSQKANA